MEPTIKILLLHYLCVSFVSVLYVYDATNNLFYTITDSSPSKEWGGNLEKDGEREAIPNHSGLLPATPQCYTN